MIGTTRYLGRKALDFCVHVGEVAVLAAETIGSIFAGRIRPRLCMHQIMDVGSRSQMVVIITGAFTGAVFAAQTFFQFHRLGMDSAVGPVVAISMCRELGPVLAGLMVAGRVGAAMSAEIGTMKVSEQIDALRALAVHPIDYLVVPRTVAMMISMPLLVAECIGFGVIASYITGVKLLGIEGTYFVENMLNYTDIQDVAIGIIKGAVFGFIIVFISCHQGLTAREGAVGVGRATTQAVVFCSLTILISNFFLTMGLNIIFPA